MAVAFFQTWKLLQMQVKERSLELRQFFVMDVQNSGTVGRNENPEKKVEKKRERVLGSKKRGMQVDLSEKEPSLRLTRHPIQGSFSNQSSDVSLMWQTSYNESCAIVGGCWIQVVTNSIFYNLCWCFVFLSTMNAKVYDGIHGGCVLSVVVGKYVWPDLSLYSTFGRKLVCRH